jgi:hypothetical protein
MELSWLGEGGQRRWGRDLPRIPRSVAWVCEDQVRKTPEMKLGMDSGDPLKRISVLDFRDRGPEEFRAETWAGGIVGFSRKSVVSGIL